jgi:antibiotic biosynthesis monooxygenase (ABM) superfamily enzyme
MDDHLDTTVTFYTAPLDQLGLVVVTLIMTVISIPIIVWFFLAPIFRHFKG